MDISRLVARASLTGFVIYTGLLFLTFLPRPTAPGVVLCGLLFASIVFAGSYCLFAAQKQKRAELIDQRHTRLKTLALLPWAYISGIMLMLFFIQLSNFLPLREKHFLKLCISLQDHFFLMTFLWVLQAFAEELFFRGFVYRNLKRLASPWAAFLLGNACFVAAHLPDVRYAARLLVASILFTLCYDRFRSLYIPTAVHAGLNTYAQFVCMLALNRPLPPWWQLGVGALIATLLPVAIGASWRSLSSRSTSFGARRASPAFGAGASDLR